MKRPLFLLVLLLPLADFARVVVHSARWDNRHPGERSPVGRMVQIRGGTMQMGINPEQIPSLQKTFDIGTAQLFQDEVPKHQVSLDGFYLDQYLVTNAQFKRFTDANPDWQADRIARNLHNGQYLKHWSAPDVFTAKADHPVVNVSWYAAVAFCQWAGKRLPTEAEWEYAARGRLDALFPWGNQGPDSTRANFSGGAVGSTSPVGKYPANTYGLFDMAGNVWQFLADEWKPYPSVPQKNPVAGGNLFRDGADFLQVTTRRVIRGGSFDGAPVNLWVEYRDSHPPEGAKPFVGFRCAK
jgi:formylglycine-generating enzyme required for sulfatase activity